MQSNGQWPDVVYTAGCDAPTANWKAQAHWSRICRYLANLHLSDSTQCLSIVVTFASAWHGGFKNAAQWVKNDQIRAAISSAMGFWFSNDFTNPACLDSGGDDACPCGTPGLWNSNWFSNVRLSYSSCRKQCIRSLTCACSAMQVIGVPTFVGEVCLLLGDSLTASELEGCKKMTGRSFATFDTGINGVSAITGANALDIASIGIDLGLLTQNATLIDTGFTHVHDEAVIQSGIKADGIRADGSFGQHAGIIYNGNYGND